MLRVAILADTHGHLDSRVAELVAECDLAVHGGDIGNAGVLRALQPRQGRVIAVVGNNDIPRKWPEHERDLLAAVPEVAEVQLPGGILVAIHGHQLPARTRHDRLRRRFGRARAVVYGHSHRLAADRDATPWILNPGAAGRARTYGGPSCMILDASELRWTLRIERFEPLRRHPATSLRMAGKLQLSS
jgi:putative phosphoesterase